VFVVRYLVKLRDNLPLHGTGWRRCNLYFGGARFESQLCHTDTDSAAIASFPVLSISPYVKNLLFDPTTTSHLRPKREEVAGGQDCIMNFITCTLQISVGL